MCSRSASEDVGRKYFASTLQQGYLADGVGDDDESAGGGDFLEVRSLQCILVHV
jgi:hypothetical protein